MSGGNGTTERANECVQWKMVSLVHCPLQLCACACRGYMASFLSIAVLTSETSCYFSLKRSSHPFPSQIFHSISYRGLELHSPTLSLSCHSNPRVFQPATSNKAGEGRYPESQLATSHILKKNYICFLD